MLAIWRVHGFDEILRRRTSGGSSGGVERRDDLLVRRRRDGLVRAAAGRVRDGLGLLAGSACPHYDDEELRRPIYRRLIDEEGFPAGYAADSGVALHFVDGELAEVITAREEATGYRVERGREEPLAARLL